MILPYPVYRNMARKKLTFSPVLALALILDLRIIAAQQQQEDVVGGLFLYRSRKGSGIQYLLQQKAKNKAWTLPKGPRPEETSWADPGESAAQTAIREAEEETSFELGKDFVVDWDHQVYFEYEKGNGKTAKVSLWPAKLKNTNKKIELSEEHVKYTWLDFDKAVEKIEEDFKDALTFGDDIINEEEDKQGYYLNYYLGKKKKKKEPVREWFLRKK